MESEADVVTGPWWSGPAKYESRTGVRHLNPLNVKAPTPSYWRGQVQRDSRGHAIFEEPADGTRAAVVLLRTYWNKYGLQTVAAILSRWAPVTDTVGSLPGAPANSPREYSLFVEKRTDLKPMQKLELFSGSRVRNKEQLIDLVVAMAEYEIGSGFRLNRRVVEDAIARL